MNFKGNSLTYIDSGAFKNCVSLKKITLPDRLVFIGDSAFASSGLEEIVIPKNVDTIYSWAFAYCTKLKKVTFKNGVKELWDGSFQRCTALKEITIPKSIEVIQSRTFIGCRQLKKVNFKGKVKEIDANAFLNTPFYKKQKNYSQENIINTLLLLRGYKNTSKVINIEEDDRKLEDAIVNKINKELDLIGIGTHLHGRKYLCDAIYFIIQSGDNSKVSIVQHLVGKYKKSSSTISRAMQNAILHAWRITPIEDLSKHYTARVNYETGVPTPTEFIYYYADKIRKEI